MNSLRLLRCGRSGLLAFGNLAVLGLVLGAQAGRSELDLGGSWQFQKVSQLIFPPSNNWQTVTVRQSPALSIQAVTMSNVNVAAYSISGDIAWLPPAPLRITSLTTDPLLHLATLQWEGAVGKPCEVQLISNLFADFNPWQPSRTTVRSPLGRMPGACGARLP